MGHARRHVGVSVLPPAQLPKLLDEPCLGSVMPGLAPSVKNTGTPSWATTSQKGRQEGSSKPTDWVRW